MAIFFNHKHPFKLAPPIEAIKQCSHALHYASDSLKDDKIFILEIVKHCGFALKYSSNNLKNDEDIVLAAVKKLDFLLYLLVTS